MLGLAIAMGAFVLLSPVIQPWYLLWAIVPLAASTPDPRYRKASVWLTVLFSVTIMPNGATIPAFVIVQAVVVGDRRGGRACSGACAGLGCRVTHPVDVARRRRRRTGAAPRGRRMTGARRRPSRVDGLVRRYGSRVAVDGVSFTVAAGELVALLGPNGAGKTSTLDVCTGFARPDGGTVRVLGLDPWRRSAELRPRIGVMLQAGGSHGSARAGEMLRDDRRAARPARIDPSGCWTCSD